jgi:hypothetical protein
MNYKYVGHNGSEDTCLHQVVAQEDIWQHTQEPQTTHCLNKVIIHSYIWKVQLNNTPNMYNHVYTSLIKH